MTVGARFINWLFHRDPKAPQQLPSPDDLAVVAQPNGEAEAQLLHDMLADAGIRSMVQNRDAASAQAVGVGPTWSYDLLVLRKDLARARGIVGEAEAPPE